MNFFPKEGLLPTLIDDSPDNFIISLWLGGSPDIRNPLSRRSPSLFAIVQIFSLQDPSLLSQDRLLEPCTYNVCTEGEG